MSKHSLSESYDDDIIWTSDTKKKKRSRWGATETEKAFIPGMPTTIPVGLSKEQEELYLLQLQIEEISRRLRTGDLGIPANPEDRCPSPEPIYNSDGKRLNTREFRTRKKLEEDRHDFILRAQILNPDFKPPIDYKPPIIRVNDKVMIPQDEHPDINFVGLLIGPRGNTLKNLEKDTGAKIIIRGKGSVKEGKIGRKDGQPLPGEDEPLHAYVTANNPEHVKKAVEKIKDIIKQGIEVPEGQNDLRRQQLRELALLNGTLRENDALSKLKQFQVAQTIFTNTLICTVCGGAGHLAQDCKQKRPAAGEVVQIFQPPTPVDKAKMDSEYMSLMAELGEGPILPASSSTSNGIASSSSMVPSPRVITYSLPTSQPRQTFALPPPPVSMGGVPRFNMVPPPPQMPPPSIPGISVSQQPMPPPVWASTPSSQMQPPNSIPNSSMSSAISSNAGQMMSMGSTQSPVCHVSPSQNMFPWQLASAVVSLASSMSASLKNDNSSGPNMMPPQPQPNMPPVTYPWQNRMPVPQQAPFPNFMNRGPGPNGMPAMPPWQMNSPNSLPGQPMRGPSPSLPWQQPPRPSGNDGHNQNNNPINQVTPPPPPPPGMKFSSSSNNMPPPPPPHPV